MKAIGIEGALGRLAEGYNDDRVGRPGQQERYNIFFDERVCSWNKDRDVRIGPANQANERKIAGTQQSMKQRMDRKRSSSYEASIYLVSPTPPVPIHRLEEENPHLRLCSANQNAWFWC